jgi:NTE family protein
MPRRSRPIDLALQGGGALGAYTWGVLDRLLEDERVGFGAVSGASAGAMNAVVLADGLARGGRRGARDALRSFWMRVSNASGRGPLSASLLPLLPWPTAAVAAPPWAATAPWNVLFEGWGRALGSAQFNPLDVNPLRDILADEVDFARLRAYRGVRVSVCATQVRSGRLREFGHDELSVDAVMASACCFAPSSSTARRTGTAATWPTPRCCRWSRTARATTWCWCRSTPVGARRCRRSRTRSPTASTRSSSTAASSASCARSR